MAYAFNNDKTRAEIIDLIYPVGSIYMSVNNTNPSNFIGGTWVAWGAGKVPVGVNAADSDFNAAEKTGGEKTHTLTAAEMPKHTHTGPSHTHSTPNHSHTATSGSAGGHTHTTKAVADVGGVMVNGKGGLADLTFVAEPKTASSIASSSNGAHTHSITVSSGGASNTGASGTGATGSAGSGSAHNNLQPYITCYMWKRTA